ncbi:MAG TPA: AzlD domain-containing protein [Methylomirabilota bacterium]|nr:AzlD domain-containing protein [Methylomirabilota bacterium]
MTVSPNTLLAIVMMGFATYLTRVAGLYLADRLPRSGAVRVALDALPPAVLTAVMAPAVLTGPIEMVAGLLTALAALRLPLIVAVAVGIASVAAMRFAFG